MTDYDYILEQCRQGNDGLGNTLVKTIPTSKLAEKRYQDSFLERLMDYEVVLAVLSDYHMLDSVLDDVGRNTDSRKIDEILRKEYNKDFVLGCMLVEKFIHIIAPRANAKVRCYGKDKTKDTASGFNSSNVLIKSKIQNENYQINRLKNLKNTE